MSPRFDEVRRLADLEKNATAAAWVKCPDNQKVPMWGIRSDTTWEENGKIYHRPVSSSPHAIMMRVDADVICGLRNAAPWLLEVAGCFQPGYAARLSKLYVLIDMYHPDNDEDLEMIEYLLKAAKIMEERE